MRYLPRRSLPEATEHWLRGLQGALNAAAIPDPQGMWARHRPTMNTNGVVGTLIETAGPRGRCMYCGDSRATDVEHHRPKARYPHFTFEWTNLLWPCGGCNRKKGSSIPIGGDGAVLLLDPTAVDPWDHLFLVHETGELTPRVDPASGVEDPVGAATVNPDCLPLNIQSITEARRRAWRTLSRAVTHFLRSVQAAHDEDELASAFEDCERTDVSVWVLFREGARTEPFASLHAGCQGTVARLREAAGGESHRRMSTPPS